MGHGFLTQLFLITKMHLEKMKIIGTDNVFNPKYFWVELQPGTNS